MVRDVIVAARNIGSRATGSKGNKPHQSVVARRHRTTCNASPAARATCSYSKSAHFEARTSCRAKDFRYAVVPVTNEALIPKTLATFWTERSVVCVMASASRVSLCGLQRSPHELVPDRPWPFGDSGALHIRLER